MSTFSSTSTYTTTDVGKVIDRFAADLRMVAQATGLMSREYVARLADDVKLMAQRGYLDRVDVVLTNALGTVLRAAEYRVATDASGWTSDRPGNNLWPRTPGGELSVVIFRTPTWWALTEIQRQSFLNSQCSCSWGPSDIDTSYSGLVGRYDRRYASNGYGVQRTIYGDI